MAKTLREFLEERAIRDFTVARNICLISKTGSSISNDIGKLNRYQNWMKTFDPEVVRKMHAVIFTKSTLSDIALYLFSVAGEAIKELHEEVPNVREREPNFPWLSFMKIRDLYIHLGETEVDSDEYNKKFNRINEELIKICDYRYFNADAKEFKGLPKSFRFAISMLGWASALDRFNAAFTDQLVEIGNNQPTKKLSKELGFPESDLPILLYALATVSTLCHVNDQLKLPSRMFRKAYPRLFEEAEAKSIQQSRNRAAHFDELFHGYSKTNLKDENGKTYVDGLDLSFFEDGESKRLGEFYKSVPSSLGPTFYAYVNDQKDHVLYELRHKYDLMVLGIYDSDPQKRAAMDKEVEWITKTHRSREVQDAYVLASGCLVQKFSASEVSETLRFIHGRNNKLNDPKALEYEAHEKGHAFQQRLRLFVDTMQKALPSKKEEATVASPA